jgi:hypothetical protein
MLLFKAQPAIDAVMTYMEKFNARSGVEIPLPIPKAMVTIFPKRSLRV